MESTIKRFRVVGFRVVGFRLSGLGFGVFRVWRLGLVWGSGWKVHGLGRVMV